MSLSSCRTLLSALCLQIAIAAGAYAADPAKPPPESRDLPTYEALDANADGVVTLPEIVVVGHPMSDRIKQCDADHDDKLTREEYAACHAAKTAAGHK